MSSMHKIRSATASPDIPDFETMPAGIQLFTMKPVRV